MQTTQLCPSLLRSTRKRADTAKRTFCGSSSTSSASSAECASSRSWPASGPSCFCGTRRRPSPKASCCFRCCWTARTLCIKQAHQPAKFWNPRRMGTPELTLKVILKPKRRACEDRMNLRPCIHPGWSQGSKAGLKSRLPGIDFSYVCAWFANEWWYRPKRKISIDEAYEILDKHSGLARVIRDSVGDKYAD